MKDEEKIDPKWKKPTSIVLYNRMINLVKLFNKKHDYPFKVRMCGFRILIIKDAEDLKSRIRELADVLNVQVDSVAQLPNGSEVWKQL